MLRIVTSTALAAVVTFGLFTFMRLLVDRPELQLDEYGKRKVIDFVRLKRESRTDVRKRELPTRQRPEQPPEAPKLQSANTGAPGATSVAVSAPPIETNLSLVGNLELGAAPADTESVPVVRVEPIYPRRAAEQFIEGWVTVQFDITPTGSVTNVVAIAAKPKGVFEQAAVQAARKWKYKPKMVDGKPMGTRGVKVRLTFELD